jgi:hypothetical protein
VILKRLGYPVLLVAALFGSHALLTTTQSVPLATGLVVVAMAALLWALEQVAPFEPSWAPDHNALFVDTLHSLVSGLIIAPLVRGVALAAVASADDRIDTGSTEVSYFAGHYCQLNNN